MKTLDGLFLRQWLKPTAGALFTFILLFLLVDVFGLVEDLIEHWPGLWLLGNYIIMRTGYAIFFLVPMALLIGGFWMAQSARRTKEWTVSLLSGRHPLFLLKAPLIALVLFTLAHLFVNLAWMPGIANKVERLREVTFEGKEREPVTFSNIHWRLVDDRTLTIERFIPGDQLMTGVIISKRRKSGLVERIDAPKASYRPEAGWVLDQPNVRTFKKDGSVKVESPDRVALPLAPPRILKQILRVDPERSQRNPIQYSYEDLRQAIQFKTNRGMNATPEKIYLHWKYGFPLTSLVLGVMGILIGFRTNFGRAGGIGLCLVIGFGYWIVFSLSISMGKSAFTTGLFSPILHLLYVYLPPTIFLGASTLFWSRE